MTTLVLRPGLQLPRATVSGGGTWGEVYSPLEQGRRAKNRPLCGGGGDGIISAPLTGSGLAAVPAVTAGACPVPTASDSDVRATTTTKVGNLISLSMARWLNRESSRSARGPLSPSTTAAIPAVSTSCISTTSGKPCFYFSCFFHFPQVRKVPPTYKKKSPLLFRCFFSSFGEIGVAFDKSTLLWKS